jgi:drug/metabolite transporter (DMT)-like permease
MRARSRLLAELGLVYCALVWGSTFIVVKAAVGQLNPLALVGWRFLLSAALMAALALVARRPLLAQWRRGLWLGLLLAVLYVAQTVGLVYTLASNSGFITGLFIVFVPPLSWLLFRRAPRPLQLAAICFALAGLWLLTGGVRDANRGDWITLCCAVTYAAHVIYAGRCMESGVEPYALNFQQMLVTALAALVAALILRQPLTPVPHLALSAIVFLAVFPTVSAFLIQLLGQRHVDETRTALIFTLEPVFAALFAWTLGGEGLNWIKALGGGLMVLAMLISELGGQLPAGAAVRTEAS